MVLECSTSACDSYSCSRLDSICGFDLFFFSLPKREKENFRAIFQRFSKEVASAAASMRFVNEKEFFYLLNKLDVRSVHVNCANLTLLGSNPCLHDDIHSLKLLTVRGTVPVIETLGQLSNLEFIEVSLEPGKRNEAFVGEFIEWATSQKKHFFRLNAQGWTVSYTRNTGALVASRLSLLKCVLRFVSVVKSVEYSGESLAQEDVTQLIELHAGTLESIHMEAAHLTDANIVAFCPNLQSLKVWKMEVAEGSISFGALCELKLAAFHYYERDCGGAKVPHLSIWLPDDAVLQHLLLQREQFPVAELVLRLHGRTSIAPAIIDLLAAHTEIQALQMETMLQGIEGVVRAATNLTELRCRGATSPSDLKVLLGHSSSYVNTLELLDGCK